MEVRRHGSMAHGVGPQGRTSGEGGPVAKARPDVGVYASFTSMAAVEQAIHLGWSGFAATGGLGTRSAPYTAELSSTPHVQIAKTLAQSESTAWWLSYWTVSWPLPGHAWGAAGFAAGEYAAQTLRRRALPRMPAYVVLDPEGYHDPATTASNWAEWLHGWASGLRAGNPTLQAAFYCDRSQFTTYRLDHIDLPAVLAVSPIERGMAVPRGPNILGYAAYYAACPAADAVATVAGWGGRYSTIQFRTSAVDCSRR